MAFPVTPPFVAGLVLLILVAGAINGVAGFGFAVVGTMGLATVVAPATAVVFMILPILAVNISLAGELSRTEVEQCGRRFSPLLGAALIGTILGMAVLDVVPEAPLRVGLGVVALAFVVTMQDTATIPGLATARRGCFVESTLAMAGVGGLSGLLFGGTNVGVQLVAYLKSCDLSHDLFVGVVALLFLGLNAVRVGAAGLMGMYPDRTVLVASAVAAVPAIAGVAIGKRFRDRITEPVRRTLVLGLLTVIGLRLLLGGAGLL